MNTEYQKQLQRPHPKTQSRVTITIRSALMSRPCSSARGPKPPVAPKPRQSPKHEGESSHSTVSNGDITFSDRLELEQDTESEVSQDESDTAVDSCVSEFAKESGNITEDQLEETYTSHDGICDKSMDEEIQVGVGERDRIEIKECMEEGREDRTGAHDAGSWNVSKEVAITPVSDSVDHIKTISDVDPLQGDPDNTADAAGECPENETITQDHTGGELEVNVNTASPSQDAEESSSNQGSAYAETDTAGDAASDPAGDVEEPYFNETESSLCEQVSEEDTNLSAVCAVTEAPEETTAEVAFPSQPTNGSRPSLCEEYPYDVIGPLDDTQTWQQERATKDPSGRFRFSEEVEDVFETYSVIEVVPADVVSTSDPEAKTTDEECTSEKAKETETTGASYQEPFYVSSDDVAELEEEQERVADGVTSSSEPSEPQAKESEVSEAVDEYADIDGSQDGDDQPLECVSEDYVEIGDEDESGDVERTTKGKSTEQQPEQQSQSQWSQAIRCQPRLRLCNITVPCDLDLGRTPELTNRVVFAHTTEAFEEDIEDLDCHIVPFFEDSDSDSDEHIYEEAGFDSEGENFTSLDRKTIVTRSRSLSGKVPGYVPETVPEETGSESQTHDYYTVSLDQNGDLLKPSDTSDVNRMIPSLKPRRFLLYPRSYSVEGRDTSLSGHLDHSPRVEDKVKRKDETLSLPCVITSSGSFSQRSHQSSSGVSTPTSLIDIPPPFELAYITKRPITKSSPSLLIQHESSDKPKKKKTSFKRFLALKFRRKNENKAHGDGSVRSSRSSSESSHHGPVRLIELDRGSHSGSSPQPQSRIIKSQRNTDFPAAFVVYKDRPNRKGAPKTLGSRGICRVESFEDRSRPPFMPLPSTKPRSISFPSADTSDYENIPAMSSDYENIPITPGRPTRAVTITEFFDEQTQTTALANENDGYVDMNSFAGIENKTSMQEQEQESAYTEPFPVCVAPSSLSTEEDHGRTSEEEEDCSENGYDRQVDGRSRAYYVAKELWESEREHLKTLKRLHEDWRAAVEKAVGEDGAPVVPEGRLAEILSTLPQVYELHTHLLTQLDARVKQWEDNPRVVEVFLSCREEFGLFVTYINTYDRSMALLEESCGQSAAFATVVKSFEQQNAEGVLVPVKHQLLQVIVRVLQYRMLLTDYLNNLSPDSKEYEDTQAALVIVSEVADHANDSLKEGENLLRLVHIDHSVKGRKGLLQPGRVFLKEGTLMKVSRKSRQPRHLFLMNDVMVYTYPQQDGKYRMKNTLPLSGMKVSKPVIDNVLNTLRIEVNDITITLSASSLGEREDWFHTLSRAIADHGAGLNTFSPSSEVREKLWMCVGEAAPVFVPIAHAMMCMNCASDFSLTLRRHHCNACGKVVCRACSRNRYPLRYLKDRMSKVCDRCYAELRKRGGNVSMVCGSGGHHTSRVSRPLSAVFQGLQPPSLWRTRKNPLAQVCVGTEGSTMSGSLQRRKKSKRKWKRLWFLLKDKVLYTFTAREDKVASESLPLQGLTVKLPDVVDGEESDSVFQLYNKKTLYYTFRADDQLTARRWVNAMEEATVL